jgi:hypothetical protein
MGFDTVACIGMDQSLGYDSRTKSRPTSVATSWTVPGRRIDRADGSDHAFSGHFSKKPSNLSEINPQSRTSPIKSYIKLLELYQIEPAVQAGLPPHSGLLFTRNGPWSAEFSPKPFFYFSLNSLFT